MGKEVVSPLVSIICNTYNHVNYIRQCLDGFLMQETNFPIEILVHDDASTDGTANIVREYEDKYPDLIKPIYQTENQYSKGVKVSLKYQYSRAQGKYIALCEGDDYWTDPLKLQKQVDFLENNGDYVACTHVVDVYKEQENVQVRWGCQIAQDYDIRALVFGSWLYHPLSVMFRRDSLNLEVYEKYKNSKDLTLFFHLLIKGKGYYLDGNMAVYRRHERGVWSGATLSQKYKSDFESCKGIYVVEKSNIAMALLCERCFRGRGRRNLWFNWRISLQAMFLYTCHVGLTNGLRLFCHKFLIGGDASPWEQFQF